MKIILIISFETSYIYLLKHERALIYDDSRMSISSFRTPCRAPSVATIKISAAQTGLRAGAYIDKSTFQRNKFDRIFYVNDDYWEEWFFLESVDFRKRS